MPGRTAAQNPDLTPATSPGTFRYRRARVTAAAHPRRGGRATMAHPVILETTR